MNVCSHFGRQLAAPVCSRFINNSRLNVVRRIPKINFCRHSTLSAGKSVEQPQKDEVNANSTTLTSLSKAAIVSTVNTNVKKRENETSSKVSDKIGSPSSQNEIKYISESTIAQAKSFEELLQIASSPNLTLKQACLVSYYLGQMSKSGEITNLDSLLENDKRFLTLCNLLQRSNHTHQPQHLLTAIIGLRSLDTAVVSELLNVLVSEIKWSMRRCSVLYLSRIIDMCSSGEGQENTEDLKEYEDIFHLAVSTLQRRWVEVTSGSDFILTFKILHQLDDATRSRFEDRAVEMVHEFTPIEMAKLIIVLSNQKRRPTPLLRALAFHLSKSETKLAVKDLIELIYALNELSFRDPILLKKLSEQITGQMGSIQNSALVSSLVTSLGQMKYKHNGVIQSLEEWMSKHLSKLRSFDYASWLMASSVLNISSEKNAIILEKGKSLLSKSAQNNYVQWTNIVHSLAVLNQCTPELLATVLQPQFIKQIDSAHGKLTNPLVKLLNLNSVAKHKLIKNYSGPLIEKEYVKKWTAELVASTDGPLSKLLIESLGNFLPLPKYLIVDKKLDCGVFIDAICMLNEKMDPVPVDLANMKKDWIKVAFVVHGYPSLCLGIHDPTGSTLLNMKILQCEGYRVIPIPYTEFSSQDKVVKRVQYLEHKLKTGTAKEKSTLKVNR